MPQVRTIEVLRAARKLVANPETWTRKAFARNADDQELLFSDIPRGTKFCAIGAVGKSMHEHGVSPDYYHDSWRAIWDALDRIARRDLGVTGGIGYVNDFLGRAAALSVIDAAISELVQRGEG